MTAASEETPDLTPIQAKRVNHYLTQIRDTLYRLAQDLGYNDPSRHRLWELAGEIEDEKIALLRRCRECAQKGVDGDD